nr:hypothetical protein L203_05087 [Cryptococcus depauperatus CBS 7841]
MVLDKRNEPMVQNTAVQNALLPSDIVGLKRKMDDVSVDWLEGEEKENEGRDKKQLIKGDETACGNYLADMMNHSPASGGFEES